MIFSYYFSIWLVLVCFLVGGSSGLLLLFAIVMGAICVCLSFELFSELEVSQTVNYLMVDFISVSFVILSVFVSFLSVMSMAYEKNFFGVVFFFCLMNFLLVSLFCYGYLFIFFIMLELSMVPIFMILSYWGMYKERFSSSYYFIFYSFMTPMPLLLCIGLLMSESEGLCYYLATGGLCLSTMYWIELVGILVGFLSKLPLYSLHIWLPKAHVDAPVGGSMVLAGILLKMGAYGLLRLLWFDGFLNAVSSFFMFLGLVGCLLSGVLCVRLVDFKVVVAFSSVCHMSMGYGGLVPLKFFSVWGSFLMFVGHGIVSPALFYIGGLLYSRSNTRLLKGGTIMSNVFFIFFLFMVITNFSFPPMINFFGEVGIFYSLFSFSLLLGFIIFMGFFFSVVYMMVLFTTVNGSYLVSKEKLTRGECNLAISLFLGVLICTMGLLLMF